MCVLRLCVSVVRVCLHVYVVCFLVIEFRLCRATRELIPVQIPFLFFARTNIFPLPPFSSFDISSDFVFVFWLFFLFGRVYA